MVFKKFVLEKCEISSLGIEEYPETRYGAKKGQ